MNQVVLREERVDGVPELADAFPVDDAQFTNPMRLALVDEIEHDLLHVLRAERMQVQNAI